MAEVNLESFFGAGALLEMWVEAQLGLGKRLPEQPPVLSSPKSPLYPFILEGLLAGAPEILWCLCPWCRPRLRNPHGVYGWHHGWASTGHAAVAGCRTSTNLGSWLVDG